MARRKQAEPGLADSIKTILYAGLFAAFIHSFLFAPFWIPSGSMVPSLLVGDYLFVNKFAYGFSHYSLPFAPKLFTGRIFGRLPPRDADVVFVPPGAPDDIYIKRVIGLPGDTIQVTNGQLFINGTQLSRTDVGNYNDDSDGGPVPAEQFTETLPGGKTHAILKLTDDGFANNTPLYTVPPGDLFMMGDNRDNSEDSRFMDGPVGYVPVENVLGPAVFILGSMDVREPLWAFWEWPMEMRWGRMFHGIS